MKKILLTLSLFGFLGGNFYSQEDNGAEEELQQDSKVEEELRVLYADEDYRKCADKAVGYMEKDKTKDDPTIYIYASMACLRMSEIHEYREKFKNVFKDALKYAAGYRKKDKTGSLYSEYLEHFEELKKIVAEEIDNYFLEDDKAKQYKAFKKSIGLLKNINKFAPEDLGALMLSGLLDILTQNTAEGKATLKVVLPQIKEIDASKFESMTEMEQVYLRMATMEYANYLVSKKKLTEAKEIIEIGKPFFYEENEAYKRKYDERFKQAYDKIVG